MNKHLRRLEGIKRARRILRIKRAMFSNRHMSEPDYFSDDGEYAKILIKTHVPCSCPMCGNPRRYFGERTIQEKKAFLDEIDE